MCTFPNWNGNCHRLPNKKNVAPNLDVEMELELLPLHQFQFQFPSTRRTY